MRLGHHLLVLDPLQSSETATAGEQEELIMVVTFRDLIALF